MCARFSAPPHAPGRLVVRVWKSFRVNMMYWRFRYVTRNRLRLQSWWNARRRPARPTSPYRERGSAMYAYARPSVNRRSWLALLVMVGLLTVLTVYANSTFIAPGLVYAAGALI